MWANGFSVPRVSVFLGFTIPCAFVSKCGVCGMCCTVFQVVPCFSLHSAPFFVIGNIVLAMWGEGLTQVFITWEIVRHERDYSIVKETCHLPLECSRKYFFLSQQSLCNRELMFARLNVTIARFNSWTLCCSCWLIKTFSTHTKVASATSSPCCTDLGTM